MKARTLFCLFGGAGGILLGVSALAGQAKTPPQQLESLVVNIEVPVRVLKKGVLVEGLTLADFEVLENGVPQKVEAVYLIKDKQVIMEEKAPGALPPAPRSTRHYLLYLELKEYIPRIGGALDFFFAKVLGPKDSLFVVTPAKAYKFHSEVLSRVPRPQASDRLSRRSRFEIMGKGNERGLFLFRKARA